MPFPAGDYKFLPVYGLVTPGNYTWPELPDAPLSDALCVTHTGENFPATFMLNVPLDAVPSYTVSLDGPKQTVNATLRRAVSRVDVLFIRAEKDPATGSYAEKSGDDVFGSGKLAGGEGCRIPEPTAGWGFRVRSRRGFSTCRTPSPHRAMR